MPRRPSIHSLQASLNRLSLADKQHLLHWLAEVIQAESEHTDPMSTSGTVAIVERKPYDGKTYQLEKRRCGKVGCGCLDGEISEVGHGPYWYAYWRADGKLKSRYVGKRPPWQKQEKPKRNQRVSFVEEL
jgi:hypothetical protein